MNTLEHPNPLNTAQTVELEFPGTKTIAAKKTVIAAVLGLIIAISFLGFFDSQSEAYLDGAVNRALIAYAVARGINALVSVLQTISFIGIGFGEVLDPVNDLVERFAAVMELAIASLYIQKILLAITSSWFFKLALGISGGILILSFYVRTGINNLLISRTFISLVFIRFSISIVVVLNGMVASAFVNDKIDVEMNAIELVEKSAPVPEPTAEDAVTEVTPQAEAPAASDPLSAVEAVPQTAEPAKKGLFGKLKEFGSKGVAMIKEKYSKWNPKALKEKLDKVVGNVLNAMALFLLKSLILPLVFLYGLKYALTQVWDLKPVPLYTGKPRLTLGKQNREKN